MPEPAETPSTVDQLVEKLTAGISAVATNAARAATPPVPTPDPSPAAPRAVLDPRFREEYKRLTLEGKVDEAMALLDQAALTPGIAAISQVRTDLGKANVERLADRFGDTFTKRRPIFEAKMREFGVTWEQLADPRIVDQVWQVTYSSDPTYHQEEAQKRFDTLKAEEIERARKAAEAPSPLAPITDYVPADDTNRKLAEKHFSSDPDERQWEMRQIDAYLTPLYEPFYATRAEARRAATDAFLRQSEKDFDPESHEATGVGRYRSMSYVQIGGKSRVAPPSSRRTQ